MFPIRDNIPSRHVPVATWAIIAINFFFFFRELSLPAGATDQMIALFGIIPARFTDPAWAAGVGFPHTYVPFLTTMFLHGGWLHISGNMWALWIFGDNVEDRMGPLKFCVFYVGCGIAAGLIHVLTHAGSRVPAVGASGAIAGVMGAYFVLYPRARIHALFLIVFWPVFFEIPAWVYLGFWLLIQFFSGTLAAATAGQVSGIAWWAHIGGFAMGILTFWAFLRPQRSLARTVSP